MHPWAIVLGIAVPIISVIGGVTTALIARGAQRSISFKELAERLDRSEQRERIRDDYIHQLRNHISAGLGTQPPPWPDGLTT